MKEIVLQRQQLSVYSFLKLIYSQWAVWNFKNDEMQMNENRKVLEMNKQ